MHATNELHRFLSLVLLITCLNPSLAAQCPVPPPAANFSMEALNGTWYEIGKYQTLGGALIEGDCVCTELVYYPEDENHATVANICRDTTPDGKLKESDAQIAPISDDDGNAGAFQETFCPTCPAVSYTIAALDQQSMVEFDCTVNSIGVINYCFHVMSRTPTMDEATLDSLLQLVDEYGLNPNDLEWKYTNQTGCGW
jgi:apolipoprotein D and lipocalin family protein